jgi:tetratricopeptide (TPR) repeat protein
VEDKKQDPHTVAPKLDNEPRDTPHNPPTRTPANNERDKAPTPRRPVMQTPTSGNPSGGEYVPAPPFIEPPVEDIYYTYPYETPPEEQEVINYKELGLRQFEDEDYYTALESFEIALANDTGNYSLYYNIGTCEIEIEKYDYAVIDLTIFINNVIDNGLGYYQRGLANFYLGNKDAAFDDLVIADQYNVDEAKVILKRYYDYY